MVGRRRGGREEGGGGRERGGGSGGGVTYEQLSASGNISLVMCCEAVRYGCGGGYSVAGGRVA